MLKRKRPAEQSEAKGTPPHRPPPSPGAEVNADDLLLPATLPFKRSQAEDRFPRGSAPRPQRWKHLKQILQAEDYHTLPASVPTYVNIEAPPSMYPAKKYCDVTGLEAPYTDPHTKLRYADAQVFRTVRSLPYDVAQGLLSLRNAQTVLK